MDRRDELEAEPPTLRSAKLDLVTAHIERAVGGVSVWDEPRVYERDVTDPPDTSGERLLLPEWISVDDGDW